MEENIMDNDPTKPVEITEGVTPPAELLLTEVAPAPIPPPTEPPPVPKAPAKPFVQRFKVTVPAGHPLPMGEAVKTGFNLTVEAGVRWHPEWDGPKITVNAYRFFHHGDCLCWSGDKALAAFGSLMPPDVGLLAKHHGQAYVEEGGTEDQMLVRVAIKSMGLTAPSEKQPLASFILPEQMGKG